MDAKDLRTESALSERNNDGSKYSQSGGITVHCDRNKSYQDIGSNSLGKVDAPSARPCAVIGPDRVVPPPATNETYLKKGSAEPWPCMDNLYHHTRRPPEYPHKLANFQNPTRNISPRQTFQENMQRIMVPPSYNSVKISDDTNYAQMPDRINALPKNVKINVPPEAKFCDVPYTVYSTSNEQKNVRNADVCLSSVNPTLTRTAPHGWHPGSVNIRPTRTYGAPELYQYQEYPSCAGPRPIVPRPNRTVQEEPGYVYADPFYHQEGNIRFKPYPTVKERFPQQRYDYVSNYANPFHPPPAFPPHKYELQKPVPPHPYHPYPPIKYVDRVPEPIMESYQRNPQGNYNLSYRNQIIHPNFGPVLGNGPQNKIHSYPPDGHIKPGPPNKLPYDNAKAYIDYENGRSKMYPPSESYLINEMGRVHPMKSQVIMPNYPSINMHNIPPNPYYKKDQQIKNYEYLQAHFRGMEPNVNIHNPMVRHQPVFSPNTLAISPTDSSASNDTSQTLATSQEDCGYVSQSSSASVRSMDSGINRLSNDYIRKYYDSRFGPIIRTSPMMSKSELNSNTSKEKKNIDVRQFLQMWNEGDEESEENISKETHNIQPGPKSDTSFGKTLELISQPNQEQLYVLGSVNVPSEELGKYEHIQKVSKLPENIKGYNHIELLNQFEEAIETSNMSNYKAPTPKDFQIQPKCVATKQTTSLLPPRPLSPLDVEAKISQSVIHKEVGCNFEIKPCSPKMMNVEVATPVQNILSERAIEKVANPVMLKSPRLNGIDNNIDCNMLKRKDHRMNINNEIRVASCKMVNTQFSNNIGLDSIKNSYSLQDLESSSGLCLASLPRLDNDIELNFPEVNQQFINANKKDSSVLTNSLKDLPTLEGIDPNTQSNENTNDVNSITRQNDVIKSPADPEKEFSKLSKYRKTKASVLDSKENLNAVRTDSVIIKNPENSKNYDDSSIFSPNCLNNHISDIQQAPINLTSQKNMTDNLNTPSIKPDNASKDESISIDIAIDFSLNKNCSNDKMVCTDIKINKETKIVKHNTVETKHSILDEDLTNLSTFSNCDSNIQHDYTDQHKLDDDNIACPTKYSEAVLPITNDDNFDENTNLIGNSALEAIFTKDEYLSPMPSVNDDISDPVSPAICVKQISEQSSNSLIPIEIPVEILKPTDNDKFSMNIGNNNDLKNKHLDKPNEMYKSKDLNYIKDQNQPAQMCLSKDENTADVIDNMKKINDDNAACYKVINNKDITEPQSNTDASTEQASLNRATDSFFISNMDSNNLELTNKERSDNNAFQSESISQKTNSDLLSSNSIITNIQDNYHMQNSKSQTTSNFDLESLNDVTNNQQESQPKTSEIQSISTSSDDIAMHSSHPNKPETDSNLNVPSPNSVGIHIRDGLISETTEQNDRSNLFSPSPINIEGRIDEDFSKNIDLEINSNFDSPTSNNVAICSPSLPCQTDTTESYEDSTLDLHSIDSSITLETNENLTKNTEIIGLFEEMSNYEKPLSVKEQNKMVVLENAGETSAIQGASISHIETLDRGAEIVKYICCNIRYLSYGSKRMYSPWMQKLVMFCEGCTSLKDEVTEHALMDSEMEPMNVSYSFDNSSKNCYVPDEKLDLAYDNDVNPENSSVAEIYSNLNANIFYKIENANITEFGKQSDTNKYNNNIIDSNIPIEYMSKTNTTSKIYDVADNLENKPDELDTLANLEQPADYLPLEEVGHYGKQFSCTDKINEPCDKIPNSNHEENEKWNQKSESNEEAREQWNKQSDCKDIVIESNELSKPSDKQSNGIDELLEKSDKQSDFKDNTSEQSDIESKYNDDCSGQSDKQIASKIEELKRLQKQPDYISEKLEQSVNPSDISHDVSEQSDNISDCNKQISEQSDEKSDCDLEGSEQLDKQPDGNDVVLEQLHKQSDYNDDVLEQWDKQHNCNDEVQVQWDNQFDCNNATRDQCDEILNCNTQESKHWDKQSNCSDNTSEDEQGILEQCNKESDNSGQLSEQYDKQTNGNDEAQVQKDDPYNCNNKILDQCDEHLNSNDKISEEYDRQSISNDEVLEQYDEEATCNDEVVDKWDKQNCNNEAPEHCDTLSECIYAKPKQSDIQSDYKELGNPDKWSTTSSHDIKMKPSNTESIESFRTKTQTNEHIFLNKNRQSLKRSLSDSAINVYNNSEHSQNETNESVQLIWPFKRRKVGSIDNDMLAQNLCNIIQSNRRNSISSIYNEENVSFCILIDNSCIISEEENDDQEKICYTELSEECLAEIQTDLTKDDENIEPVAEITTTPQVNDCEFSDSYTVQGDDDKIEESWVEDVACVETVISDDIAEDIEICEPSSPKDDALSDNDESGVFSSSEHTDKVKYIYGDKMCSDDAQFVETLYNTPQMDVTKTLIQRESLISTEYYDNDSLEKILSESNDNDQKLSPYIPEYTEPLFSPRLIDNSKTVDNKENMDIERIPTPQHNGNALDAVLDTGIEELFNKTELNIVHSNESSVDNVFTYKENSENTNYTTSSSPEVSSTTSEDKNSSIFLKITNYKGSRISQINDVRDSQRSSCKFTEDKGYVQSHSNFSTHRPLLTKAAQKYIPPLKESMRDLKVKLSLPQHSLMKLKQLKLSKDEPKVCKQNISVPRISKKPKPKFEDVLKSIDEIQFKMHKEKTKKSKKSIPKVVIKKNENGSHYASTSDKNEFNPDLTGRKWQPWVFIEKNHFIDKMATKNKTKAVYNHRKRTFVLAEKFQKYRSVNSAKFVISPPISDSSPTGLKYTIRLKHSY